MIFTIGNLATKFISFFLIPLYTNVLSTQEYGTIDLVVTICTITVPIISLNISESVMRFNLDKGADKDKITKTGLIILFFGCLIGLILIPIYKLWNAIASISLLAYFYIVCSASCQFFLADLRGKEKLLQYSIGNVLNTLLIACLNILFLLIFKWGMPGYLLAYTIANFLVALYALFVGKGYRAIYCPLDKQIMRAMVKYSIFLIPNSFMWWIMNSSDHFMVTSMIGTAANGIYAISYKLPTLISTVTGIFNQAWSYSAIREEDSEDSDNYTNRIFFSMRGTIFMIGICMITIMKPFLRYYVSADFFVSWKYTPFLVIGCVYLTMATFMSTSYTVHKDSKGFLVSGTFGAILNITLNLALIPLLGVYGAAIATCISYIAVFIFRAIHTRKYIVYKVIDKEFLIGTAGLIINSSLMFFDGVLSQITQIAIVFLVAFLLKNAWLPYMKLIVNKTKKSEI